MAEIAQRLNKKYLDLLVLVAATAAFFFIILSYELSYLWSITLFFVVPCVYISLRERRHIKKAGLFAGGMLSFGIIVNYIAHQSGSWLTAGTLFGAQFLNRFPFEDLIWMFFILYYVVIFYEYFLDTPTRRDVTTHLGKRFFVGLLVLLCLFFISLLTTQNPDSFLNIPYFYLSIGLLLCFGFPALIIYNYPRLALKFVLVTLYFAGVYLLQEIIAIKLGHWSFPATDFIGYVSVGGALFPLEELIFWILLGGAAFLAFYEFFDDDRK